MGFFVEFVVLLVLVLWFGCGFVVLDFFFIGRWGGQSKGPRRFQDVSKQACIQKGGT